jgi:CheY-like chemotaxis protein
LAEDGLQGVQICQTQQIDLVITDLLMPEQEGIETILKIRNDYPKMPILAMSGGGRMAGTMDILHTAKLLGAHKTFSKPFNPIELVETVKQLIG